MNKEEITSCGEHPAAPEISNVNFDFLRFYEALNDQLVLGEGRFRAADANEDPFSAASEVGFCVGIKKAIELYQKYCPSGVLPGDN